MSINLAAHDGEYVDAGSVTSGSVGFDTGVLQEEEKVLDVKPDAGSGGYVSAGK
jgi:hypothetical protein